MLGIFGGQISKLEIFGGQMIQLQFLLLIRPKENKALFLAHRVTKINLMRAAAKIFFLENVKRKISSEIRNFIFQGHNRIDELELASIVVYITSKHEIYDRTLP